MMMRKGETRTFEQVREHYLIEKELASQLRNANKEARRNLYGQVYDELYRRVPHHEQLRRKTDSVSRASFADAQISLLKRYLHSNATFLEIGAGDCSLAFAVCTQVRKVYVVDVSEVITRSVKCPDNFELIISDGCNIGLPDGAVDVAYSHMLMEHLHPDDALEQLKNIHRSLRSGGVYLCVTPNGLSGPHDISMYFDEVATGFHLKEYTNTELTGIFRAVGFSRVYMLAGTKKVNIPVPFFAIRGLEDLLLVLPPSLRKKISRLAPIRLLLGIKLVAIK